MCLTDTVLFYLKQFSASSGPMQGSNRSSEKADISSVAPSRGENAVAASFVEVSACCEGMFETGIVHVHVELGIHVSSKGRQLAKVVLLPRTPMTQDF